MIKISHGIKKIYPIIAIDPGKFWIPIKLANNPVITGSNEAAIAGNMGSNNLEIIM